MRTRAKAWGWRVLWGRGRVGAVKIGVTVRVTYPLPATRSRGSEAPEGVEARQATPHPPGRPTHGSRGARAVVRPRVQPAHGARDAAGQGERSEAPALARVERSRATLPASADRLRAFPRSLNTSPICERGPRTSGARRRVRAARELNLWVAIESRRARRKKRKGGDDCRMRRAGGPRISRLRARAQAAQPPHPAHHTHAGRWRCASARSGPLQPRGGRAGAPRDTRRSFEARPPLFEPGARASSRARPRSEGAHRWRRRRWTAGWRGCGRACSG